MLVSIVTVCFNSERTIRDTLNSVEKQSHNFIEHIIIDGKSKDKTLNIVSEYSHVSRVVSERDEGIYDAMNKGLSLCNGDIVGFLNSDDFFHDYNVISGYVEKFKNHDADVVYGDLDFIAENQNKTVRRWQSSSFEDEKISQGWIPPHPTFYARRDLFNKLGGFDKNFKFASDYDLMIRFLKDSSTKSYYFEGCKVKMRYGGATTKSFLNILLGNIEILKSLKKNNVEVGKFFLFQKLISKLMQFMNLT
jgi:glycosyltransferase involved in cell wall biosynthesis